ncbi:hypothetical protein E0H77_10330 [Acinetobacter sp. ANC 4633]|uniref:hypothetical protein n=1 Tax=Acinetobacter sp. ANC 4633 TaxID=2529845 RepID=UPI00103A8DC0|nr:hypothetical protein [Acinetobacter sp. ANC 4633]TCB24728.1 hypothetical protein E0H77_10330 [Acinetobacter sp. ANC 4633]
MKEEVCFARLFACSCTALKQISILLRKKNKEGINYCEKTYFIDINHNLKKKAKKTTPIGAVFSKTKII